MNNKIHPVLLCGGSGTRLWPLSRKSYPKQFTKLIGEESLFQSSALRMSGDTFAKPMIVTTSDFRFIVVEQLASVEIIASNILLEPSSRNTAAAICAAALALQESQGDSIMLVAPSDHVIPDRVHFGVTVEKAVAAARDGRIVTFGIVPDRAETGYGWIELETQLSSDLVPSSEPIISFIEKPNTETATQLLESKKHLWNSGIFMFTTTCILDAFSQNAPDILEKVQAAYDDAEKDLGFTCLAPDHWAKLDDISIDFAIMERATNLSVVPYKGQWTDLGDWNAVSREGSRDANGNVESGPSTFINCQNTSLIATSKNQEIVAIGLKDIVAVAMPDAVLIAHKDNVQDVKLAVASLKGKGASQAEILPRDYRPWGWYERLIVGNRFQVKRIVVNPGGILSLQSHYHRAEHWIVVVGSAKVTIHDEETLVTENQSVYIPLGAIHRLENPGKIPMTLIEVQTGDYLGEDDIRRYEDVYRRS